MHKTSTIYCMFGTSMHVKHLWSCRSGSKLKCEGIWLKCSRNQWCLCCTTTERLAGQLISSGFGLWCWGEGEDSLAWPTSLCQDGYNSPLYSRSTIYYKALCQGVCYKTVWHMKIMQVVLMYSKEDTPTLIKEGLKQGKFFATCFINCKIPLQL